jgi:hypothetical protein
LTENHPWLSRLPSNTPTCTTPYSRISSIAWVITPYALLENTQTQLAINQDGQTASYSRDGVTWQSINFQDWSTLLQTTMHKIEALVSNQLPRGMNLLDLVNCPIVDDYTKASPHLQDQNRLWMEERMQTFTSKMLCLTEDRHRLFKDDQPMAANIHKYIRSDQKIRGLVSTLLVACSAVTMRAFQFKSIILESCDGFDRNMWILDNRFIVGKPKAKQKKNSFADTLFWFPRRATTALAVLFFFQKPLICDLLRRLEVKEHYYASHLWPMPPISSGTKKTSHSMVWEGPLINKTFKGVSGEVIKPTVSIGLVRQVAEGLLRDKIPLLFEVFQMRNNLNLKKDSYRFSACLQQYANHYALQSLASAANIPIERAAACLTVVDIWQCMHKVETCNVIWQPMVENSYMFPTTAHEDLAYLEAQNLTETIWLMYEQIVDQKILTRGLNLLATSNFSEVVVCPSSFLLCAVLWSHLATQGFQKGRSTRHHGCQDFITGHTLCVVW